MKNPTVLSIVVFLFCFSVGCNQSTENTRSQQGSSSPSDEEESVDQNPDNIESSETSETGSSNLEETEISENNRTEEPQPEGVEPLVELDEQETDDEYRLVSPSELEFSIEDFYYNAVVGEGGSAKPIGGGIGSLLCNSTPIELASEEFDNGFIVTKDFGRVKILFSSSLTQSGMAIFLTDTQKNDLLEYAPRQ